MLLWIAGYPRTGSTVTRMILEQCFEINTFSLYNEPKLRGLFSYASRRWAHLLARDSWLDPVRRHGQWVGIKTHGSPLDAFPALYTVRDYRDAVVSAAHFWEQPVEAVICGQIHKALAPSAHYRLWDPTHRPHTLMVRFEETMSEPETTIRKIADFLHREPVGDFENRFAELAETWPRMFVDRRGAWKNELTGDDLRLFDQLHGAVNKECGYE